MNTFESFSNGKFKTPLSEKNFSVIEWVNHPKFAGVKQKNIITAKDSAGLFSYHLVYIAPNKEISLHTHENNIETHEIIAGNGKLIHSKKTFTYNSGDISLFSKGSEHAILAGENGIWLFAKFFPAII